MNKEDTTEITIENLLSKVRYYYPKDFTHPNDYGAYLFAGMAVKEYCGQMRTGNYAEAYGRLAGFMTRHSEWKPKV